MDRSDWLSILGCARDLAAYEGAKLKYPKIHNEKGKSLETKDKVKIEVHCPELVNRFNTRVFKNIKVKKSPDWLKGRLEAYGIPSINNIVDITNYVMVEYGQPLHAQDLSKMKAREIVIRRAKPEEKVITLLGEIAVLTKDNFVLTQAGEATVVGGIVGGASTGVTDTTTEIILDAGNYNQVAIRKASRALKIQNETVLRSDKFLHPELTQKAIERATYLILELAGGEYFENDDWYPNPTKTQKMELRYERIKKIGGVDFDKSKVKEILEALEYKIVDEKVTGFEVEIPYFRTDVIVEDDIVSDIYRIYDYKNIPVVQINAAPPKEITPKLYVFEDYIRDTLVGLGFHEHITNPIIKIDEKATNQVILTNALSPDKSAMRTSIRTTLKDVFQTYSKARIPEVRLFEIGRTYEVIGSNEKHNSYRENRALEVFYKNSELDSYSCAKYIKSIFASVMLSLGIANYIFEKNEFGVNVLIGKDKIGFLDVQGFTLNTQQLLKFKNTSLRPVNEAPDFTTENISLVMNINESFGPALQNIEKFSEIINEAYVTEEYIGTEVGDNKKAVLVEIKYKTSDTQKVRDGLIKMLNSDYGYECRS